ncbi:MAG: hypothetical protein ACPL7D_09960 [Candidatus Sumerlaeaceae bacterium]
MAMFLRPERHVCFFQSCFDVVLTLAVACTLCGCQSESREAAVSSRAARPLAPTPAVLLQKTEFRNEPCAIVPVEGGTVTLEMISSEVLRLQLRDTAGRPGSFATLATLETKVPEGTSQPERILAFYRLVGGFPEGLYARISEPFSAATSGTLHMMQLNGYAIGDYVCQLRCPAEVAEGEQALAIRDTLTSPAVHITAAHQFISVLENLAADGPAEHIPQVLDLMLRYLHNSAELTQGATAAAFSEAASAAAEFRAKVSPQGQFPANEFEQFRDRLNELLQHAQK